MTATPEGTTHRRTLRWQNARVLAVRDETPTAKTYRLRLPEPRRHLAGQHYVLRLTAPTATPPPVRTRSPRRLTTRARSS